MSKSPKKIAKAAPPPEAKTPRAEMTELGATGLDRSSGMVNEEWLHQLKGKQGQRNLREMSETDPIVRAILYAMEALLRPTTWTVESGGETPADEEAKEYLESVPNDMSHTMSDFISEWMATPVYGFSIFEVVLKLRNGEQATPGESSMFNDGRLGVRKLAVRHPTTVNRWVFDDAGGIQGVEQIAPPRFKPVVLPIEKCLLFRTLMRKGNPEGESLLKGAYIPWYRKKKLEAIEAIGIERNMAGFPLGYHPPEWGIEGSPQSSMLTEFRKVLTRMKVDEQAGLALPAIFDENGNRQLEVTLLATSGKTGSDVSPVIERYTRYIAMSILADVILLGHEKVGSFALASSKTNLFAAGLGALLDDIESVLNRHLVPRLMKLNGFKLEKYPQFRHSDLETTDLAEIGAYVNQLAAAGFPLFPSENNELENELMRVANLPVPENYPGLSLVEGGQDAPELDADGNPIPKPSDQPTGAQGDAGVTTDLNLNGAQITAAVEVLQAVATGEIADVPAVELLVAVGIERDRATMMVSQQSKYGVPPTAVNPPAPVPPKNPKDAVA